MLKKLSQSRKPGRSKRKRSSKPKSKKKLTDKHLFRSRPERKLSWQLSKKRKIDNKPK